MLEKIMDLQILLYSMAALGALGAIGMLTTNLTYRRMLKSTGSKTTVLQEEIVDKITSSIKQTAASGSHFSKMLTPEEEKIMREIIREFMT